MSVSAGSQAAEPEVRGGSAAWPVGLMAIGAGVVWFANTAVGGALPSIASDMHTDLPRAGLVVTSFTLTMTALLIVGGRFGDSYGYRRIFTIGCGFFAAGALLSGLAPTLLLLVCGQVVMGIGGACMLPATLSVIYANVPVNRRGIAIGVWAAVVNLGFSLGPIVGGAITGSLGWRWIYLLTVPIALLLLLATGWKVAEARGIRVRIDYLGAALLGLSMICLVAALSLSTATGWLNPQTLVPLLISGLLLIAFIIREINTSHPIVKLKIFANREFSSSISLNVLANAGVVAFSIFTPLYLSLALGVSPQQVAVMFLPNALVMTAMPLLAGWLIVRVGVKWPVVAGVLAMGAGIFVLSLAGTQLQYWLILFPAFVLIGAGNAFILTGVSVGALNSATPEDTGMAAGILKTSSMLGSTLGTAAVSSLFYSLYRAIFSDTLDQAALPLPATKIDELRELGLSSGISETDLNALPSAVAATIKQLLITVTVDSFSNTLLVITGLFVVGLVIALLGFRHHSRRTNPAQPHAG